jgi:hypothetical protein
MQIRRGNACNAVYGSPIVAQMFQGKDFSEAASLVKSLIEQTAQYIETGSWTK